MLIRCRAFQGRQQAPHELEGTRSRPVGQGGVMQEPRVVHSLADEPVPLLGLRPRTRELLDRRHERGPGLGLPHCAGDRRVGEKRLIARRCHRQRRVRVGECQRGTMRMRTGSSRRRRRCIDGIATDAGAGLRNPGHARVRPGVLQRVHGLAVLGKHQALLADHLRHRVIQGLARRGTAGHHGARFRPRRDGHGRGEVPPLHIGGSLRELADTRMLESELHRGDEPRVDPTVAQRNGRRLARGESGLAGQPLGQAEMHVQLVCVAWDGQGSEPAGDDTGTPGEDDAAREHVSHRSRAAAKESTARTP